MTNQPQLNTNCDWDWDSLLANKSNFNSITAKIAIKVQKSKIFFSIFLRSKGVTLAKIIQSH
jgi:hypothetical protein